MILLRGSIITDLGKLYQSLVGELGIHLMGQSVINDEVADILETVLLPENTMSSPDLRSQTIDGFELDLESVVKSGQGHDATGPAAMSQSPDAWQMDLSHKAGNHLKDLIWQLFDCHVGWWEGG